MPDFDLKAALLGYEEGDLPLLEELGINFKVIKQQIIQLYMKQNIREEMAYMAYQDNKQNEEQITASTDLTGPLIFLIVLCMGLLLNGKVLFGCVYFLSIALAIITQIMVNCMNYQQIYKNTSQYYKQYGENTANRNYNHQKSVYNKDSYVNHNQFNNERNTSYVNMEHNQNTNNQFQNQQYENQYPNQYENQHPNQYENQYENQHQNQYQNQYQDQYKNNQQQDNRFTDHSRHPQSPQMDHHSGQGFIDGLNPWHPLSFLQITSVLGYSILPIVLFVFLNILLYRFYNFMLFLGIVCAIISAMVCNRKLNGGWLIYTLWLNYMTYVVLALY